MSKLENAVTKSFMGVAVMVVALAAHAQPTQPQPIALVLLQDVAPGLSVGKPVLLQDRNTSGCHYQGLVQYGKSARLDMGTSSALTAVWSIGITKKACGLTVSDVDLWVPLKTAADPLAAGERVMALARTPIHP